MIFKDRQEAGVKLLLRLVEEKEILKNSRQVTIVSLLRGGIIIGNTLAKGLEAKHLPLAVTKIPAPHNPELAIGALCFDITYLEKNVVGFLRLKESEIVNQITTAKQKFNSYLKSFKINESDYYPNLKNRIVILTDDGIATGSTVKVAVLYLKSKQPKSIILAVPVAPSDFSITGIDKEFVLHKQHTFGAVSQFYEVFPQIEDAAVNSLLEN